MDDPKTTSASETELHQILEKLDAIEKQQGNKWAVPVVVAVITGLLGLINIVVQITTQSATQQEITRIVKEEETLGTRNANEKADFCKEASDLIRKINTDFERVCSLEPNPPSNNSGKQIEFQGEDTLTDSLEQYQAMLETHPANISEETIGKLQAYSEFVVKSLIELHATNPDKTSEILAKSRQLSQEAKEALKRERQQKSSPK